MPGDRDATSFLWIAKHRQAILILLIILFAYLGCRLALNRRFIDDPPGPTAPRAADLADRLDPNTADWQELAAIPGLGEKKARSITDFREKWHRTHPGQPAFQGPQDLRLIKGIGPATVSNLRPFLIFPGESTTQP